MPTRQLLCSATVAAALLLAACGSEGVNTEGQALGQARSTLEAEGVSVQVSDLDGQTIDPEDDDASLIVCEQSSADAKEGDEVTLQVAASCPEGAAAEEEDDDDDKKKPKRR